MVCASSNMKWDKKNSKYKFGVSKKAIGGNYFTSYEKLKATLICSANFSFTRLGISIP